MLLTCGDCDVVAVKSGCASGCPGSCPRSLSYVQRLLKEDGPVNPSIRLMFKSFTATELMSGVHEAPGERST